MLCKSAKPSVAVIKTATVLAGPVLTNVVVDGVVLVDGFVGVGVFVLGDGVGVGVGVGITDGVLGT
jgi:hypothetical protein